MIGPTQVAILYQSFIQILSAMIPYLDCLCHGLAGMWATFHTQHVVGKIADAATVLSGSRREVCDMWCYGSLPFRESHCGQCAPPDWLSVMTCVLVRPAIPGKVIECFASAVVHRTFTPKSSSRTTVCSLHKAGCIVQSISFTCLSTGIESKRMAGHRTVLGSMTAVLLC